MSEGDKIMRTARQVKVQYRANDYDWTEWKTPEQWDALLDALLRERGYDLKALVDAYTLQEFRAGRYTYVPLPAAAPHREEAPDA